MKHTEGEWVWKQNRGKDDYKHSIFVFGSKFIAELSGKNCTKSEVKANARLIAAAPVLLEACQIAVLALTHEPINPDDIKVIRQAIAKAEKP